MKKRGQVWVETVIYTLIGFMLISLVFAYARPKIREMQNEIIIKNSIYSLEQIDLKMRSAIQAGVGNRRVEEIRVNLGNFFIDAENNLIYFEFEVNNPYSEVGLLIPGRVVDVITLDKLDFYLVKTILNYSHYNLTLENRETIQVYPKSNIGYEVFMTYVENVNSIPQINLEVR